MKNALLFLLLISLCACDDGDLQIETLDFDSVNLNFCDDPIATSSNILFKINDDETLILTLQSGVLNNGVIGTDTTTTESTVPNQSQVTYRIFSDNVTSTYFCGDIPPVTPTVIEEIDAEDGTVTIKSIMSADSTLFTHVIELSGISLVSGIGERITDLTISEFGEVTTAVPAN
ncbi:hypothetical protein [Croceitalea rosinachiae]|uniref:Uncharacterized protein n=1 Tax=Croceitalea rosinachiae TaxID=3075596 RepID=A0ABU3AAP2_9FLAO|nr:hypothetical protein [Croceitalea sp. F388]MDT0606963.1 hypothetical protein [Croceitalea sp. F388]